MGPDGGGLFVAAGTGTGSYVITPLHPLTPLTPHPGCGKMPHQQQPTDESPNEISEVIEGAMMKTVSDTNCGAELQGVIDGLSRPRNQQLVKMNNLLLKGKKGPEKRLDGLAKFEGNRRASRDKK